MQDEMDFAGVPVTFIAVNNWKAMAAMDNLTSDTEYPVFQDVKEINVWALQSGKKDDIYVYDAEGFLSAFFAQDGAVNINLSTEEGYQNLKDAIFNAFP